MERGEPALKPEWLLRAPSASAGAGAGASAISLRPGTSARSDNQGRGGSSRNRPSGHDRDRSSQQSSSRKGSSSNVSRRHDRDGAGKSRGYSSFGRSNRERGREKEIDLRDREGRLVSTDDSLRDGFESFSSCRSERDRLNRTRAKTETWNRGVGVSSNNGSFSKSTSGSISFEREFPYLGAEEKNGKHDISRVPSPGINTPIQSIPLVTATEGWNSVLAEVPVLNEVSSKVGSPSVCHAGPAKQPEASSSGTALSMAETVMQSPLKISTAPQSSSDAQKIEERTIRQCILRPRTPSASKISVLSSSDKSKNKGARAGDHTAPIKAAPQLSMQPASYTVRAPVKTDLTKPSQSGSFQVLSREQNGVVHTAKDCRSNSVRPVLSPSASKEPLKNPIINQKFKGATNGLPLLQGPSGERRSSAKDKHKFFELLRTKSLNGSGTAAESGCHTSPSSLAGMHQNSSSVNQENDCPLFDSGIAFMENGNCTCADENSCDGSQKHLSDNDEVNSSSKRAARGDDGSHRLLADSQEANSAWESGDTADEVSQRLLSDSEEAGSSSELADTGDEGSHKPPNCNDESHSSSDPAEAEDEEPSSSSDPSDTVEARPTPEELAFLISLGWDENEEVLPLGQDEIADFFKHRESLSQQKIQPCKG